VNFSKRALRLASGQANANRLRDKILHFAVLVALRRKAEVKAEEKGAKKGGLDK